MPNVVVRRPPFRKRGQPWLPLSDPAVRSITALGGVVLGGTAAAEFAHTQVAADLVVEWDLDNDGDYDSDVEDITAYVMELETVTGRDWASNLTGKVQPGQLKMTLDDTDGRFSYFNADSPLAVAPFSLRTGRRIRVRTAESVPVDPVLLVRDRFNRADADALGDAETGQTWETQLNSGFDIDDNEAVAADGTVAANTVATVDCGQTDCYVQATFPDHPGLHALGVVARWTDSSNYLRTYISGDDSIVLAETVAGTPTSIATFPLVPWAGMTLGLEVVGTAVRVLVGGAPVIEDTTGLAAGTEVGLYAFRGSTTAGQEPPAIDDFHVWDRVASVITGVVWTGTISEVQPDVELGPFKVAQVTAEGILAKAASTTIQSPRVPGTGNPTGLLVGDAMARTGLCHPPSPTEFNLGDVVTGPLGIADTQALNVARLGEETELGMLYETPEGYPGYQSAFARLAAVSEATFSDDGVSQFGYSTISQLDWQREVVNQVTAGVAPSEPTSISFSNDFGDTAFGVTNHCDVTLPTTAAGDFVLVIIRRSNQDAGVNWLTPIWWTNHRPDEPDAIWTRVYSKFCDGTESGDTIRFYTDSGAAGGPWVAHIYRVQNWYEAVPGVVLAPFVAGDNPPSLLHGFGKVAMLYIAMYSGTHGGGAGSVVGTTYPDEYQDGQTTVFTTNGDVFLSTAHKLDVVEAENPSAFDGDSGFALVEASVFAVRGYNGPHELLPTIKNPTRFEATPGRFVTVEDVDSQDDHGAIRSHENASNLFASEADATDYGESVLATYADDRPLLSLSFPATISQAYRTQAARRRVGEKVTIVANGDTGLGINAEFFIENIGHKFSHGGKQWWVTWQLSPA